MNNTISARAAGTLRIGEYTVNRMGFGAMRITGMGVWGEPDNKDEALNVLKRAVELGVNFIDTADSYGPEISENYIHDALSPYGDLLIATKGGQLRPSAAEWVPDASPAHLRQACDDSLRRLGISQIPLYQLHRPDPDTPFLDSVKTLVELQVSGKIKHIGLSNVSLKQLMAAREVCEIVSVQNYHNFAHRRDSEDIVNYCEVENIAFIPYFPIGGGQSEYSEQKIRNIADKYNATTRQIALAWLLARSPVILPIPGTSSIDHLEENIAAASIKLDQDDMNVLELFSD